MRQATARRPVLPQAFLELGDQLGALGRFDEAAAAFEAGLALAPEAMVLRVGLGHLSLKRNDRARARALFAEVRAAAPERYDALVGLAQVLATDGEPGPAAELYRQALAARPGDSALTLELGKCLLELGQREAGETALRAAAGGGAAWAAPAIQAPWPRRRTDASSYGPVRRRGLPAGARALRPGSGGGRRPLLAGDVGHARSWRGLGLGVAHGLGARGPGLAPDREALGDRRAPGQDA